MMILIHQLMRKLKLKLVLEKYLKAKKKHICIGIFFF